MIGAGAEACAFEGFMLWQKICTAGTESDRNKKSGSICQLMVRRFRLSVSGAEMHYVQKQQPAQAIISDYGDKVIYRRDQRP